MGQGRGVEKIVGLVLPLEVGPLSCISGKAVWCVFSPSAFGSSDSVQTRGELDLTWLKEREVR